MTTETPFSLRPETPADEPFLARLYASTRTEELAVVDWSEDRKAEFLRMQFDAQNQYYHQHYGNTSWDIILVRDVPVGRLYVARWQDELRIVDIALLPEYRGRGIGSRLIAEVIREAAYAGKPVRIHVEQFNPAMVLYERFGFRPLKRHGVYVLMQRDRSLPLPSIS